MTNVVISGTGSINSLGLNAADFWDNCHTGQSVCTVNTRALASIF